MSDSNYHLIQPRIFRDIKGVNVLVFFQNYNPDISSGHPTIGHLRTQSASETCSFTHQAVILWLVRLLTTDSVKPLRMPGLNSRLFSRIMSRNYEVYALKIITLSIAFASSVMIILFSIHEFGYDTFHNDAGEIYRVIQKNTDAGYSGNRLSVKISTEVVNRLKEHALKNSLVISRVKIMNKVTVLSGDQPFHDQKIHAADSSISRIFTFDILEGDAAQYNSPTGVVAMLSERAARRYTGSHQAAGKTIRLLTFGDTLTATVVAVFRDFPMNTHEDFDVFINYSDKVLAVLNFDPDETGVYLRACGVQPDADGFSLNSMGDQSKMAYSFQPLTAIYFGPRALGEEARHGDSYSVFILICVASLILFLALTSFINLTAITLPHRSKELAVKKLAGVSYGRLLYGFLKESSALVGISLLAGLLILICTSGYIEPILGLRILPLILTADPTLALIVAGLFVLLTASPVFMTIRFVRATPHRLLRTDTITFPRLKRVITFLQLGISIFLIIASVVVRRQINYSLVKEPGQNHDQVVYLHSPSGITNEGIIALRSGWKKSNPNILDVMAVSQLPDRVSSKEVGSEFYSLLVDPGFLEFFDFRMKEGNWFKVNDGDSIIVTNKKGSNLMKGNPANVAGVVEDLSGRYNQPEKPLKIKLAQDFRYHWLCVRVLEVDIRKTIARLSDNLSYSGHAPVVNFLNTHFQSWINYQDRLNHLSEILTVIAALLSCFAIYGLSVSIVRDKLKEIAVHKLFGAHTVHITYLLVLEFVKQVVVVLIVFAPFTYILLNELLRTFAYATEFSWLDPVYPVVYCVLVIVSICGFQAWSLNRADFASALKG